MRRVVVSRDGCLKAILKLFSLWFVLLNTYLIYILNDSLFILSLVNWKTFLWFITLSLVLWSCFSWIITSYLHDFQDLSQLFPGISDKHFVLGSETSFESIFEHAVINIFWISHLNCNFDDITAFNILIL